MRLQCLSCDPRWPARAAVSLQAALNDHHWVQLIGPGAEQSPVPETILPPGPGLLLAGGGSSGRRRLCLHPVAHFDQSARATALWLAGIGIAAPEVQLFNPLPLHHVSGLMPWWRSGRWGACHIWLPPALMRDGPALMRYCEQQEDWCVRPALLSLVPTQLMRLMADPIGVSWLQHFSVIWLGGAALSSPLAHQARLHRLRLAPCYGATETAAMVTALTPQRFLDGEVGCGDPLIDVQLRLDADGALLVKTPRLALGCWQASVPDRLAPLADRSGWWRSGDRAQFIKGLRVLGRRDGAIQTGGEIIHPEPLEARLLALAMEHQLSLEAVLLLGVPDPEWGERLVALVRLGDPVQLAVLDRLTASWPAAERPRRWVLCDALAPNAAGKWERSRWLDWFRTL